jgi:hypothetical protein
MSVRITPEPAAEERKAILAALAAERDEQLAASEWASAFVPTLDDEEREP